MSVNSTNGNTNVQAEIKGDKLVITVDVGEQARHNAQRSSTGKSRVVGTTHGFTVVGDGLKVSLNVIC